ncbi:acyltransferase [Cellulosimicrobium sp. PMB13]|uniref:acyltransferase n=1 Tax=Cellulosimicrobium sp. PMB13 TaxID=3120158 RepID=UPI003F4C2FBD
MDDARLRQELYELRTALTELRRSLGGRREHAIVQAGCEIDPTVTLLGSPSNPVLVGRNVKILRHGELIGRISIGEGTYINRSAYIRNQVTLGQNVNLGPFVRLITDSHDIASSARRAGTNRVDPISVGNGAWIGAGTTVLGGVRIGEGAIVAAGAVVVHDVDAHTLVGGVPATPIRKLEQ